SIPRVIPVLDHRPRAECPFSAHSANPQPVICPARLLLYRYTSARLSPVRATLERLSDHEPSNERANLSVSGKQLHQHLRRVRLRRGSPDDESAHMPTTVSSSCHESIR